MYNIPNNNILLFEVNTLNFYCPRRWNTIESCGVHSDGIIREVNENQKCIVTRFWGRNPAMSYFQGYHSSHSSNTKMPFSCVCLLPCEPKYSVIAQT